MLKTEVNAHAVLLGGTTLARPLLTLCTAITCLLNQGILCLLLLHWAGVQAQSYNVKAFQFLSKLGTYTPRRDTCDPIV